MPAVFPFQEVLLNLVGFIHRHRIVFLVCESTRVGICFCFWLLVCSFVCLFVCLVGWLVGSFFFCCSHPFLTDFWENFLKGTFIGGTKMLGDRPRLGEAFSDGSTESDISRGLGVNETSSSGSAGQRHCAG